MSDYTDVQDDILGTIWTLFVYDFLLTFGDEVNLFLRPRQLNGPSILFLLNRYLALAVQVYHCSPEPTSYKSLQYIPWAAFSALRSYALCPAPYRTAISIAVFALSSVPYVVMWVRTSDDFLTVTVVARSSLIGAELIVLCITWYRTRETIKMSKRFMAGQDRQTFASTLLRDGEPYHRLLTSIVISRFLINLQKVKRRLHGSSRSMSELAFQSHASRDMDGFIGSLGAQLPFLDEHLGEGEDWP
ncbi:hypothetical protein BD309DRAFT_992824 [Dichomitus squalens]|nr:hypothetical protein BD309DRAFT_992824 [Dichomitus squalens]